MPVSTASYEILFEFMNDTADNVMLQSTVGSVMLERGQNVLLVLNAGMEYSYTLKQSARKAQFSCV
ncbi:hypothetical protein C8J57DRAFT_34398 [Mycena rebaudengoi]|nr:hypothetical protein C8J57DRAFT_34398 [Mycena rebaudengoi]